MSIVLLGGLEGLALEEWHSDSSVDLVIDELDVGVDAIDCREVEPDGSFRESFRVVFREGVHVWLNKEKWITVWVGVSISSGEPEADTSIAASSRWAV